MIWNQWIIRGVLGWLFLKISLSWVSYLYAFATWVVGWLPHFTLAWVPGINMVWFSALVVGLGRSLSQIQWDNMYGELVKFTGRFLWSSLWSGFTQSGQRVLVTFSGSMPRIMYVVREVERKDGVWCQVRELPGWLGYREYWVPKTAVIDWEEPGVEPVTHVLTEKDQKNEDK